jgi:hypothetical protein
MVLWAYSHQRKASRDVVRALMNQQTGCQAPWACSWGKQEAAAKRLWPLLPNERLALRP